MVRIFAVSELTEAVRTVLEGEFPFVWVRGQAVNVSRPMSGHVYFSLRDGEAVLPVVWFRGRQGFWGLVDPVTGEVFEEERGVGTMPLLPEEGRETLVAGRMTAYPPRGVYQLMAEVVQDVGVSDLAVALEALRRQLSAEGIFDPARKRPVPRNPRQVAVVTAPQGAAVQDFLRVASSRGLGAVVRIYPSPVQGDEAPARIVQALAQVVTDGWAEVVVILRGGGSLEDLWAFNTEAVVRAIAASPLPVVTGIGHEVDTTLADLAADLRAATPTHAAQLLWEEREVLAQQADDLYLALVRAARALVERHESRVVAVRERLAWVSPAARIHRALAEVRQLAARLPQRVAGRLGRVQADVARVRLQLALWGQGVAVQAAQAAFLHTALSRAGSRWMERRAQEIGVLAARLAALDPQAPLGRGFAVVWRDGAVVRSKAQVAPGVRLRVHVADGSFAAVVEEG